MNVDIPDELYQAIKTDADAHGVTVEQWVTRAALNILIHIMVSEDG